MNLKLEIRKRSLKALTHPISILAIVVLLVNDHWLRWHYPSWWTGKIGDFAWLIFAPFLLIWLLSVVYPKSKISQVGIVGFIGTGAVFSLGNILLPFQQALAWLFQHIVGWRPFMVLDPTDLWTLPGLWVGWKIWQASTMKPQPAGHPLQKLLLGWILLSFSALGTVANQPSFPDYGVYCVAEHEGTVLAITEFEAGWFESDDGGLTWTQFDEINRELTTSCFRRFIPWEVSDPNKPSHLWRIQGAEEAIEQSVDGGRSWQSVYTFPAGKEVRKYHYRPEPEFLGSEVEPGGPYNGVVDPATGNLIVSMGLEGVVVISSDGDGQRVDVGPYAFVDIHELSLGERLNKEFLLAMILGFLVVCIGSIPVWEKSSNRIVFLIGVFGGTAVWFVYALFSKESGLVSLLDFFLFGYVGMNVTMFSFCGWIFSLLFVGTAIQKVLEKHSWQQVRQLLEAAVISVILYLIPLIFWATGILPSYRFATFFGACLAALPIGYIYRRLANLNSTTDLPSGIDAL